MSVSDLQAEAGVSDRVWLGTNLTQVYAEVQRDDARCQYLNLATDSIHYASSCQGQSADYVCEIPDRLTFLKRVVADDYIPFSSVAQNDFDLANPRCLGFEFEKRPERCTLFTSDDAPYARQNRNFSAPAAFYGANGYLHAQSTSDSGAGGDGVNPTENFEPGSIFDDMKNDAVFNVDV